MRQRRRALILQPIKWIVLLGVVGTGSVYGLSAAGFIEWKPDNQLESLMFWKSSDKSTSDGTASAEGVDKESEEATVKPTPLASVPASPRATSSAATSTSTPPAADKAAPTTVVQLLSQAQSIVPANANEKAWLEQAGLIKLDPGKLFSYQAWLAEVSKAKKIEKKDDELSHVAGLLYEAAVRAGMKIGERYPHQDSPAYAASGFDVDYQSEKKDLTFYNSLGVPITVGVIYNGETPVITFNGKPKAGWKAPKITVNKEVFAPENMVITDFALTGQGDARRSEGQSGLLVKVFADEKNDGKNELIYKDFYAPHPIVIAKAPTAEELK